VTRLKSNKAKTPSKKWDQRVKLTIKKMKLRIQILLKTIKLLKQYKINKINFQAISKEMTVRVSW